MRLLTRLLVIFVPATLLAMGVVLVRSRQTARTVLLGELQRRGTEEARGLASALGKTRWDDERAMLALVQMEAEDAAAVYGMALDQAGRVLTHTNAVQKGLIYRDAATAAALAADEPQSREIVWNGARVLDVSAPVWKAQPGGSEDLLFTGSGRRRLGTVRLGIPLERGLREGALDVQEALFERQAALTLFAIGALAVCLVLFIVRAVVVPVRMLADGLARVAQGRYGARLPVSSDDELGRLTAAFNTMSEALLRTTVSKEYLDAILEHMLDSLIVLGVDGEVQSLNPAARRLLGYEEPELAGRSVEVLFADGASPFPSGAQADGRQIRNREVELKSKDGRSVPVLFSCSVIQNKIGRAVGLVCVARDLTERKRLEAQMVQSEKLAAVGQLAAGVAHEVNNPLGVILGFAEGLVRRVKAGDPAYMPLKSIEREALRCRNLVQDLLTFSRQGSARSERFEFDAAVKGALALVEAQAKVRSVELLAELGGPGLVLGSRTNVQQVVINLCTNAIDAMPDGGRLCVATSSRRDGGGSWAVLEVRDDGTGIPEDIRDKVFEPFFTTKEPGKGTGLGLSLVHEIVRKHGGTIELRSEPGQGTVFTVSLPQTQPPGSARGGAREEDS